MSRWPSRGTRCWSERPKWSRAARSYRFRWDGSQWVEMEKILPAEAWTDDEFGDEVALSGEAALVGAPRDGHLG